MSRFESSRIVKKPKKPNTPVIVGISVIVILVLLVIIFIWKIATSLWNISGGERDEVTVPDVIGLSYEEASLKLKEVGLSAIQGEGIPTENMDPGKVFKQNPEPSSVTKKEREVVLSLSTGSNESEVPDITGRLLTEAYNKLIKAKLQIGNIRRIYMPDQIEGIVVDQNPKPEIRVMNFSKVDLLVSVTTITENPVVPNLRGKNVAEAETEIRNSNLSLGGIEYTATETNTPNIVYDQDLPAFKKASYGSPIKLKVELPADLIFAESRQINFRLIVPPGKPKQHVIIKLSDGGGSSNANKDYDKWHKAGDEIIQSYILIGKAKVTVTIDGKLVRQDTLPEPLVNPEAESELEPVQDNTAGEDPTNNP